MNVPTSPLRHTWTEHHPARTHRAPWYAWVALIAGLISVVSLVAMHILEADTIRVNIDPVSTYVLTPSGARLFALGALGMAVGCVAILFGPLGAEKLPRWTLGGSAVFLLAVVGFDTDAGETVSTISGYVHRYAAGAVFCLICAATTYMWRRHRDSGYGRFMGVLAVTSIVLLLVNVMATYLPEFLNGWHWRGIPQRMLIALQIILIVLMAFAPRLPAFRRPKPPAGSSAEPSRPRSADDPEEDKVWLSGRSQSRRGALPSADGL